MSTSGSLSYSMSFTFVMNFLKLKSNSFLIFDTWIFITPFSTLTVVPSTSPDVISAFSNTNFPSSIFLLTSTVIVSNICL